MKSSDTKDAKADKDDDKAEADPAPVVTAHTITINGKEVIKYHATTGYMVLKEEEGKPLVPGATPPVPPQPDGLRRKR